MRGGKGTDHVQRALGAPAVERAPDSLAVDGNDFARQGRGDGSHPLTEALLHLLRGEQRKDAPKCVVRGNAAGQVEKRRQPGLLQLAVVRDVNPRFGPGYHGADGDDPFSDPVKEVVASTNYFVLCNVPKDFSVMTTRQLGMGVRCLHL